MQKDREIGIARVQESNKVIELMKNLHSYFSAIKEFTEPQFMAIFKEKIHDADLTHTSFGLMSHDVFAEKVTLTVHVSNIDLNYSVWLKWDATVEDIIEGDSLYEIHDIHSASLVLDIEDKFENV